MAKQFALTVFLACTGSAQAALPLKLPALQALEEQKAGNPDFDYALGLAALQAGQAELALAPLERVILTSPQLAGAWLDLALAYANMGQNTQALALLKEVQQNYVVPPETAQRIERLRQALLRPPASQWRRSLGLVRGHSSNANQVSGERDLVLTPPGLPPSLVLLGSDQRPRADGFTRLRLMLARDQRDEASVVGWRVQLSSQRYDQEAKASQDDLSLQWSRERKSLQPWRMVQGVELRHVRQANRPVLSLLRNSIGLQRALTDQRMQHGCQPGAFLGLDTQFDARPGFDDALEASLRGNVVCSRGRWQVGASLSFAQSRVLGERPGGDQRQRELQLPVRYRFNARHATELRLGLSAYQDQSGYSVLISNNDRRHVRRTAISLQHLWDPSFMGQFVFQADVISDHSNIRIFNNQARILSIGWEYGF